MANSKIYLGSTNIGSFFQGADDISIYLGENKVYPLEEPSFKWKATYSNGNVTSAECDSSSAITNNEIAKSKLASVEIGDCVTTLGVSAFTNCTGLTTVTIPNNVTDIQTGAFRDCKKLESIVIPNGVTAINTNTFKNCSGLTSCTIGSGVTIIDESAFNNCNHLTSIDIPNGVTIIGGNPSVSKSGAFYGCSGLTSIDIPDSVTSIGNQAFAQCARLTSITVNATTPPTLGIAAFDSTNNCPIYVPCESVEAYKSASVWSRYASRIACPPFEGKWKATYSDSSVTSAECDSSSEIAYREINGTGLTSVEIGDCVTSIGGRAFYQYSGLTSVTIPNSVTNIATDAFKYCSGLTSIDIPNSVISIGDDVFEGCSGLTSIDIPSGVTSIGDRTFYDCNSLTSCTIPNSVASIGTSAFQNCYSLASVTIPSGVTSIGSQAFVQCTGLTSVTCLATTPPTLDQRAFNTGNNCPIYVPSASVNAYKTATVWSGYASRIQAMP